MTESAVPGAPRAVRYVSWAGLFAGVLLTVFGALQIGVTWDEPLHVQRYNNYVETGWYLGDGQLVDGEPGPAMKQQFVYGPATMILLNGLGTVTGVEDWRQASTSADAYRVRHLGIALISFVGLLAVIGTGRLLFRRWDWAVLAGAVLALLPMWTGHSMFNLKDVPVATGYAVATFGLALLARRHRSAPLLTQWAGPASVAAGTFLAVGTRPGIWATFFASIVALLVCVLLWPAPGTLVERARSNLWRVRDILLGLVVAALGLWAIDPAVFSSPIEALSRSTTGSASFLGTPVAWYFVPARVTLQVPLLMLGFLAVGVVVGARRFVRLRLRLGVSDTRLVLVFVQVFTLPLVAMVHGASLYSDLRQLLFAAPGAALLVTFGMFRLMAVSQRSDDRHAVPIVAVATCAALLVPMVDQATLFPYDYAYYNPLTAVAGVSGNGEFYRASGRELAPYLPATGRIVCSPEGYKKRVTRQSHLDGWVDCRDPSSSPVAAYTDQMHGHYRALEADEFWAVTFYSNDRVPANCTRIRQVHRRTLFREVPMGALLRCERPFPTLSNKRLVLEGKGLRPYLPLDLGWRSPLVDAIPDGVLSRGGPSSLTFRLAEQFRGGAVMVELGVESRSAVRVTFAGQEVDASFASGRSVLAVSIPAALVTEATRVAQTLELRSADGAPLDLRLLSIQAVQTPP